ncbi:hypothetical protein WJX77_011773 [Trebouxia sp. C0004]
MDGALKSFTRRFGSGGASSLGCISQVHTLSLPGGGLPVLADCRPCNVMVRNVGKSPEIRFIDFDWAGTAGHVLYPPFMDHRDDVWPAGVQEFAPALQKHDRHLLKRVRVWRSPPTQMSDEQDKLKLKIGQAEAAVIRAQKAYDEAEPEKALEQLREKDLLQQRAAAGKLSVPQATDKADRLCWFCSTAV